MIMGEGAPHLQLYVGGTHYLLVPISSEAIFEAHLGRTSGRSVKAFWRMQ